MAETSVAEIADPLIRANHQTPRQHQHRLQHRLPARRPLAPKPTLPKQKGGMMRMTAVSSRPTHQHQAKA